MTKSLAVVAALSVCLGACSTLPSPSMQRPLVVGPAPVSFDGDVAGQAAEYTFALVPNGDPSAPGLAMQRGEAIRMELPTDFHRNGQVAIMADADTNLVLTKGWPQAAVKLAGQYRVGYDEKHNAMTVTAVADIGTDGANAPGIKVIHLRGRSFLNPGPGDYPVTVVLVSPDGAAKNKWNGTITVLGHAPDARLAPTNFHLPPGTNADFQKAPAGQVMPYLLGVLLWDKQGRPVNDVGIAPRDLSRFPRYTGGLLVQDTNGDKVLNPAADKVIGGIIGAAPEGAKGQAATSPHGADGKPVLSGAVLRSAAFPPAAGGGKPNPGLLAAEFRVGDKPGLYRPTFELLNGNSFQFTLEAVKAAK